MSELTPIEALARESAAIHAAIDRLSRSNPALDQYEAECREARRLAPHNRFLRKNPNIDAAIRIAMRSVDRDLEAQGPVPVIRLRPAPSEGAAEHTRVGRKPVADRYPQRYCLACNKPTSQTVPFWYHCGPNVLQIDMCGGCADRCIFQGAVPQTA